MLPPSSCTKIAEISWNFYASTRPLGRSSNTSASRWYYHKFSIWVTCTLCWEFVQLDGNSVYKGGRGDSLSEMGSRNRCPFPVLLSRVLLIRALSPPSPTPLPLPLPPPQSPPDTFLSAYLLTFSSNKIHHVTWQEASLFNQGHNVLEPMQRITSAGNDPTWTWHFMIYSYDICMGGWVLQSLQCSCV